MFTWINLMPRDYHAVLGGVLGDRELEDDSMLLCDCMTAESQIKATIESGRSALLVEKKRKRCNNVVECFGKGQ